MLDLVQAALQRQGFSYTRIDGQSSLTDRTAAIHAFNDNPRCTVLLASIGSAGEGYNIPNIAVFPDFFLIEVRLRIDLTAANCVHLLEPTWNPMVERQAMDRVHRIGQVQSVLITRYITLNSIETVCHQSTI